MYYLFSDKFLRDFLLRDFFLRIWSVFTKINPVKLFQGAKFAKINPAKYFKIKDSQK